MLKAVATSAVRAARYGITYGSDGLRLYRKYRGYTMSAPRTFLESINLARGVTVGGDVVECGTWKGGMVAAIAETLQRRAVLFDSFEGLPEARPIDGAAAIAWQSDTESPNYHDNCTADERDAIDAMRLAGVDYDIRKGWFDETIPRYSAEGPQIALLRIDGDWYDSVMICLSELYPHVVPGGLVLIDDYGQWDGCTRAVHDYLSRIGAQEDIRRAGADVTYLWKRESIATPS